MKSVREILNDPVTQQMRTDPVRLRIGQTVAEALASIRETPTTGRVIYLYVVDADDKLVGVVPTRRILLANLESPIRDIMISKVIAIPEFSTVLEACEFFTFHKLLAFPVINGEKKLIGVVDIELYTNERADVEQRQGNDELFQLVGVHLSEAEQRNTGLVFRRRFPWLLCNVAGGMLAALLADAYADVATLALVTPFIPVVLALAESVSIQSVSLALQSLHGRPPTGREVVEKIGRELILGIMLGLACGLVVGGIALLWKGSAKVGLSLFLGISGGVAIAAVVGLATPYLLRLMSRDPKVAAGPVALAVSDLLTLLVYFNLGRWLLT